MNQLKNTVLLKEKRKTLIGTCRDCEWWQKGIEAEEWLGECGKTMDWGFCEKRAEDWFAEDGCIKWQEKEVINGE